MELSFDQPESFDSHTMNSFSDIDNRLNALLLYLINNSTDVSILIERCAYDQFIHSLLHFIEEFLLNRFLH